MEPERPALRSLIGMIGMIVGLTLYAFLAAGVGNLLSDMHLAIQMTYYLIVGLLWIIPAKKLIYWMGEKRPDPEQSDTVK